MKKTGFLVLVLFGISVTVSTALALSPINPGDLNNDNRVDVSDVFLIVNCLGQSAATCQSGRADPNNDGAINIYDFIHVSKEWGTTYSLTAPGTVTTLAVTSATASSVTVSFTEVNDGTGQPAKYALRYNTPTISWGSALDVATGNCGQPALGSSIGATKSCTIDGLNPDAQYQVQLVSFRGPLNTAETVFGGISNVVTAMTSAGSPATTVTINANPTGIASGQSSTLSWSSANAVSCTASGGSGWSGSRATSGSQSISPTSTTTYTLICTGAGGTSSPASTTVTVTAPTPTCGNGIQEGTEQCDTGSNRGTCPATCSTSCAWNSCGGSPSSNPYANKPSNYNTVLTNYSFSDTVPVADGTAMGGGWGVNNAGNTMARFSDSSAPVSGSNVLQWTYAAGQGTPTSSASFGLTWHDYPANTQEFYVAFSVWHDPNFEWNPVSNKLFYIEPGNIILESQENGGNYLSVYVGANGIMYRNNAVTIPLGQWVNVEMQVKRGANGFIRVWMNGQTVQDLNVPVPASGGYGELKLDSTWGGGSGPTKRTSYRRVDHIYIATP